MLEKPYRDIAMCEAHPLQQETTCEANAQLVGPPSFETVGGDLNLILRHSRNDSAPTPLKQKRSTMQRLYRSNSPIKYGEEYFLVDFIDFNNEDGLKRYNESDKKEDLDKNCFSLAE